MDRRNQIFQRLKPPCVALSQAALALNGPQGNVQQITEKLDELKKTLQSIISTNGRPASLDSKLADYVFFPLSQVLKASQRVSIRSLELALQCLAVLLEHGWRSHIPPPLAIQVTILCTLMAEEKPKGLVSAESTDELRASALHCLRHLFEAAGHTVDLKDAITAEANVPQLGQTISTILDAILAGASVETQTAGSDALRALMQRVATRDIQAGFLPGIVSKLTKILTPRTTQRRNHNVLILALNTLDSLFKNVLNDTFTAQILAPTAAPNGEVSQSLSKVVDQKWLGTAASQLKPAITSIVKLRGHDRYDVKKALAQWCTIKLQLEALISQESSLLALLQSTLHEWLTSLPISMQAAGEEMKIQRVQQVRTAYSIIASSGANTSLIDKLLAGVLRDSVVVALQAPTAQISDAPVVSQVQSLELAVLDSARQSTVFPSPLVRYRAQENTMKTIEHLVQNISISSAFSDDLSRSLRQTVGDAQIATFWLLLNVTQTSLQGREGMDDFLELDTNDPVLAAELLEDMYSFSLEVLTDSSDDPVDPRLQALALRALALRSQTAGEDFRHELIDALYPVLHSLATPDASLQQDSITTLNIFTSSCAYSSVQNLIVENVDYLTNAVSLRLNAFDVSPQAPQVLLMMVRLAGASLLPYLEDTIDSIFAALQDYHGYPLLVELMFRVLSVVAEEGAKAPQLAIAEGTRRELANYYDDRWQPTTIDRLATMLREQVDEQARLAEEVRSPPTCHPRRPWKQSEGGEDEQDDMQDEQEAPPVDVPDPPPPAPKTYNLLLRISELTQHFLPSASASLRASLLSLIKTTTPAIARHENSFLPLVNTLWPEIVSRLDDEEPHVVATALDIIASLCEHAGGFMRTRIQQLWPELQNIHRRVTKEILQSSQHPSQVVARRQRQMATVTSAELSLALNRMRLAPADYSDTSTRLLWTALVRVTVSITKHVSQTPEMFDDTLQMLEPMLDDEEVRTVLEEENADAVWLVMIRNGMKNPPTMPERHHAISLPYALEKGYEISTGTPISV
ncbi:uncharacterized protein SEPMUDRAFT_69504 [Sphaerulina musiva SO2202]|uniref:ARM repeat-containing protein n=1 Tax=Sphaerulina musiva (strain SO2202) TaxID=692275 RepID=N1QDX5_SPHMS|nr:uncharacterized protein SEPMUDRAFT_69504 [Sphaerulina musiva SO2202]EMF10405.1 hypothetical protein SEPMUDRAFT_69504 [Sphaerulina musiva SO2202]